MIHSSELGYYTPNGVENSVEVGQTVLVKILQVDIDRQRISLSMKQVPLERQLDWVSNNADTDITELEPREDPEIGA